jgi:ribosomal protein S13
VDEMTDIVKKLRDDDFDFDMQHRELIAAEVERLREEVKSEQRWASFYAQESLSRQSRIEELEQEKVKTVDELMRVAFENAYSDENACDLMEEMRKVLENGHR